MPVEKIFFNIYFIFVNSRLLQSSRLNDAVYHLSAFVEALFKRTKLFNNSLLCSTAHYIPLFFCYFSLHLQVYYLICCMSRNFMYYFAVG